MTFCTPRSAESLRSCVVSPAEIAMIRTLSLAFALATTVSAQAADNEKCFGVAAAGQNDCQTANNSCAGQVADAGRGDAWIYVPAGTCTKINGGSLEPKQG